MEKTIQQIEQDYQAAQGRMDQLNRQIDRLEKDVQSKQAGLSTSVVEEGLDLDKLLGAIRDQTRELETLRAVRSSAAEKTKALGDSLKMFHREQARRRIEELQPAYETAWIEVVSSMMKLWSASRKVLALSVEAGRLGWRWELPNPLYFKSMSVGDVTLELFSDRVLEKIEQHMPEIYQASQALTAAERRAEVLKLKEEAEKVAA